MILPLTPAALPASAVTWLRAGTDVVLKASKDEDVASRTSLRQSLVLTTTDPSAQVIDPVTPEAAGGVAIMEERLGRLAVKLASVDDIDGEAAAVGTTWGDLTERLLDNFLQYILKPLHDWARVLVNSLIGLDRVVRRGLTT